MKMPDMARLSGPYSNHPFKRRSGRQSERRSQSERQFRRRSDSQSRLQSGGLSEHRPTGGRSELFRKHTSGACLDARSVHRTQGKGILGLLMGRGTEPKLPTSWASYAVFQNSTPHRSLTSFEARWTVSGHAKLDLNIQEHVEDHVRFRQMECFLSHFFSYLGFFKCKQLHAGNRLEWRWIAKSSIDLALFEFKRLNPVAPYSPYFAYILILGLF